MTSANRLLPYPSLPTPRRDWALFLDIDGTLIDLAPTPDSVIVPGDLADLLQSLSDALNGAVAVVSGRRLDDIDRIIRTPIAAAGQHGAEIRLANTLPNLADTGNRQLSHILPRIAAFAATRPGILIENKGMTIAVHFRQAPGHRAALDALMSDLVAQAAGELETIHGHHVFEIRMCGLNKRTAVEYFMQRAPFAGRLPIFIGDDRTDEDGFAAVQALGGHAIRVGLEGPSLATWRVIGPAQTRAFLSHAVEVLHADA